ncbi:DUF805 domain-containing protein [Acinetobacter sp. WZC-1]|uniref:DUF805 domain-containing protein n=1 Tax=Acinetobacter sp. WZC-1 TaxID=3459034 RepID=UPI00403D9E56
MNSTVPDNDSPLSAKGRFGRLSYLGWNLLLGFFIFLLGVLAAFLIPNFANPPTTPTIPNTFLIIVYIVILYFSLIFAIRRLHDRNHSGWLSLLIILPLINLFFLIYLSCAKGDEGTNNYGAPRITRGWEKILAWIYIIVVPVFLLLSATLGISAYKNYIEQVQQMQME